jgi:hypothetical protein
VARPLPSTATGPLELTAADGFLPFGPEQAMEPWRNIEHFRNECSPFSLIESPPPRPDGNMIVDSFYGHAFDFVVPRGAALYGFTADLAPSQGRPGLLGYLRVPYRCVPRIRVRSRAEIESLLQATQQSTQTPLSDVRLLLRGQTREHYLNRSPVAREALYGDPEALEPSLPASAVRRGEALEKVLPEWCLFIRSYLMSLGSQLLASMDSGSAQTMELYQSLQADSERLATSLDNHAFALSLAQHYGLPSMGLDLTDDLGIALFFALRRMEVSGERRLRVSPDPPSEPVLYVFALPERFCLEHTRARPRMFPRGRPDRQSAWFSHMGWGCKRNQCAEYLAAALYLDPAGDYGPLPRAADLFPDWRNDMFGSLMEAAIENRWGSPALQQYLRHLYWADAEAEGSAAQAP